MWKPVDSYWVILSNGHGKTTKQPYSYTKTSLFYDRLFYLFNCVGSTLQKEVSNLKSLQIQAKPRKKLVWLEDFLAIMVRMKKKRNKTHTFSNIVAHFLLRGLPQIF